MTMPEILRRKLMERIDIASEPDDGEVLEEIDGLILGEEETRYLPVAQKAELRRQLFYSVRRLDVLQELLEDAGITEIMVNGYQHIFVERNGRIERYGKSFTSAEKLEDVIQQIVGRCNRVVNEQNPIVDARLENGDRVNVVMKPVALNGPILTIRSRFNQRIGHIVNVFSVLNGNQLVLLDIFLKISKGAVEKIFHGSVLLVLFIVQNFFQ